MKFEHSFYLEEVRENFFVSGLMKRLWAAQMEVMEDVAAVCDKYGLRWFLDAGTLLGAVRHGGYIPWDDDFDICMLREDYDCFLEVAPKELADNYVVMDFHTHDFYSQLIRVSNAADINFGEKHLQKYHDFPYPAGIDIFCLDYLSPDEELENERKTIAGLIMAAAVSCDLTMPLSGDVAEILQMIEEVVGEKIDYNKPLKRQLYLWGERYYKIFPKTGASHVALMNQWIDEGTGKFPVEYFLGNTKLDFEGISWPVPTDYTGKLRGDYGDFMTINRQGSDHAYPIYDSNEKILMNKLKAESGYYPFQYVFSESDLLRKDRDPNLINDVENETTVFITCRAKQWKYLDPIYREYQKAGMKTIVLVLPYFTRRSNGFPKEWFHEINEYAEELCAVGPDQYDLLKQRPARIITQMGLDQCSYSHSVSPEYHIKNIANNVRELIYADPYPINEYDKEDFKAIKSMEWYVMVPGYIQSDRILVQTEEVKNGYVDFLTGQTDEKYRSIFENKIITYETYREMVSTPVYRRQTII